MENQSGENLPGFVEGYSIGQDRRNLILFEFGLMMKPMHPFSGHLVSPFRPNILVF
jgi:hypothetical protein